MMAILLLVCLSVCRRGSNRIKMNRPNSYLHFAQHQLRKYMEYKSLKIVLFIKKKTYAIVRII